MNTKFLALLLCASIAPNSLFSADAPGEGPGLMTLQAALGARHVPLLPMPHQPDPQMGETPSSASDSLPTTPRPDDTDEDAGYAEAAEELNRVVNQVSAPFPNT